jgi:peptidoglycan/xylan/chitin deacetylase (PgdA/CDA1 family)
MPYKTAAAIDAYPGTGFDAKPSYIPNDVIIPTLDDVPDDIISPPEMAKGAGNWTTADLAWLDSHNMHWDLFINTDNACDLTMNPPPAGCEAALKDVLKSHYPGNHTVHHYHLGSAGADGCADATCVKNELMGVETLINTVSGGARPHLTRFRAPFGEPFQSPTAATPMVGAASAPFGVSVGWNLDSDDSNHDDNGLCTDPAGKCLTGAVVAATVEKLIKTPGTGSAYGIVLMHGIFGWTKDALPLLFDPMTGYMVKNKFRIGTVEDAICWKYGKHSWEITATKAGQPRAPN